MSSDQLYRERVQGQIERGNPDKWAITELVVRHWQEGPTFMMLLSERQVPSGIHRR